MDRYTKFGYLKKWAVRTDALQKLPKGIRKMPGGKLL